MYLKNIKAHGFKSFADKIDLEITKGITAIVGPNGSGKSNVVDAVRWVLGEQSIKALRGNNGMTDVIFSGSDSRQSQNRAVVSLTFDNSDHYLNSEFNEIEIKRVVYRTGENDYYLNNTKVRLKDITDLFIDSGAGKESFNIISQGAVGNVINNKPEERRTIFEEAAGVLKYKKRKEESLKKLDKTKENISKIQLVIDELIKTLEPLKEQNKLAKQYLQLKEDLEATEVSLIVKDIKDLNVNYQQHQNQVDLLKEQIDRLSNISATEQSNIEKNKLKSLKLDDEISKINEELLALSEEITSLETQKNILYERQKYQSEDSVLTQNILYTKEQISKIQNQIKTIEKDKQYYSQKLQQTIVNQNQLLMEIENFQKTKLEITNEMNTNNKNIQSCQNLISINKSNIENNSRLPHAVKNIITNNRLSGIHNTIGNLISIPSEYNNAIDIALGNNANTIVVDDTESAKKAIEYLKKNSLGRATFFPMNIIKSKKILPEILQKIENIKGFIGIASNLIKFDQKYRNIIENQLGNIIVVNTIDDLNNIAREINYQYRVVTLSGEIQYTGGAISGGTSNIISSIKEKHLLEKNEEQLLDLETIKTKLEQKMQDNENKLQVLLKEKDDNNSKMITYKEQTAQKEISINDCKSELTKLNSELVNVESQLNHTIDNTLNDIIENLSQKIALKNQKTNFLHQLKDEKNELFNQITDLENIVRQKNNKYNQQQQELKQKEIELNKIDNRLDNLLLTLNENYAMTFEKAEKLFPNYENVNETDRIKVIDLKNSISKLGMVNLGAPAEYERINTRYEFLISQQEDLTKSSEELMALITEMDTIMVDKFQKTFTKIQEEFSTVFKQLFKGGKGILKLTNPDDILHTGVEIIAEPPGKKLNSIALLSGGEKTLTAIALLFAILNIKPVPFCILDEVEAALDEANVDTFGKYLESKKNNSQFILITHKKKSMEYADVLYGITMQESGVSKLVSVKLEN